VEEYELSNEEKKNLKEYGIQFQKWLETNIGKEKIQQHIDHENYFKSKLASENLLKITKTEMIDIYKQLWASGFWSNKDWKINKILYENGLDTIKKELNLLLYGQEPFEVRYNSFRKQIKGFGISAISEILTMLFPEKFCLWNEVTKNVLTFMNLKKNLPESAFKYNNIPGKIYAQCINYLFIIKSELQQYHINNFLDVDKFFWYLHENVIPKDWKLSSQLEYDNEEKNALQGKKNIIDLENLIIEYNKNRELFGKSKITEKEAMEIRSQFVSDFPPDKILDIEIDNYVIGKKVADTDEPNRKTFCYRLEFGLPGFGAIGGGGAEKFGIYYDSENKRYTYNENKFSSAREAYRQIITQINVLIESGKQFTKDKDWKRLSNAFERIDEIKRTVKSKILAVYFPESIVSINTHYGTKHILKLLFGLPDEEITEEFMLNKKRLWELKENHPIMRNWSNFDYSTFAWYATKELDLYNDSNHNKQLLTKEILAQPQFWVVRAGGEGNKGDEEHYALEANVFTIAWNELSDLSKFKDVKSLKQYYRQICPHESENQVIQGVAQIWDFINDIRKNDFVLLPLLSRKDKSLAIGRVTGDYNFKELTPNIKHIRNIEWLHKEIPYSEFDKETRQTLGLHRTVYQIHKPQVINSIKETLKKYGIVVDNNKTGYGMDIKRQRAQEDERDSYIFSLEKLSEYLCMSVQSLKEIGYLLTEKKQIIFYGPPGTSKTFVAKEFASYFTQNSEFVEIIQFHPSYSYEDFIEGIKPKLSTAGKATGFVKQAGIFKNLVDRCIKNPDKKFVLIIDEINRGNISKIFGELIYLLEYRNEKIHLTYSPTEEFYIPDNLYIIGTMNSADRSIAFVDYALRRRFYFIEFYPDKDILKKWFIKNREKETYQNKVLGLMIEINNEISKKLGKEYQIGYSYFMMNNLNYEKVKRIINYAIIPLVEQYFFGKKENIEPITNICKAYLTSLKDLEEEKESFLKDSLESFSS
jgi:hypothetical protein